MKELLKVLKISSQCEKCHREIWNSKDVTLIDREDLKAQSETKNYEFIEKARSFTQRQMSCQRIKWRFYNQHINI